LLAGTQCHTNLSYHPKNTSLDTKMPDQVKVRDEPKASFKKGTVLSLS
jgi:hypothetical protein